MATKKKTEPKTDATKWYVEELHTGAKKFYTAARKVNGEIITRGGYWETRIEAEEVANMLNKGGRI